MSSSDMSKVRGFLNNTAVNSVSNNSWAEKLEAKRDNVIRANQDRKAYRFLLMVRRYMNNYRDPEVCANEEAILAFLGSNPDFK